MVQPSKIFFKHAITSESSQFLIGRKTLIEDIANKLAEDRVSCVIYGNRGVGKTTIAWQVISLLEDKSPIFDKKTSLSFSREDNFRCAFHKCSRDVATVGELLVDVVLSTQGANRFSSVFKKLYADEETIKRIERKFNVNLLKIVQFGEKNQSELNNLETKARNILNNEKIKRQFAYEVFERIRRLYKGERALIFIDELDRPSKGVADLGDFIKDIDDVQFVFIGIAKNIERLIIDHPSAGRKLAGNDFEAPFLDENEIREIMHNAERLSNGQLDIEEGFRDMLAKYSGGIPWITQHVGYEATYDATRASSSESALLTRKRFDPAMRKVIRIYENDPQVRAALSSVREMNVTEHEILRLIWDSITGATEDELRDQIASNLKRYFDNGLERIIEAKIVELSDGKYRYSDAASRVFVKYELDKMAGVPN